VAPGTAGAVIFTSGDALGRGSQLQLIGADGNGAPRPLTGRGLDAATPAVSPDGTRVAFTSRRLSGGGIFVLTLATGAQARITKLSTDADPAWSPDGKLLAFARSLPGKGHRLMVVGASGGTPVAVKNALGRRPDFAPDGRRIVFERDGAKRGLAVATIGGTVAAIGAGSSPSWSPDGSLIAFTAPVQGTDHLFLTRPDGKGRRDISRFQPISDPAWSPDGTRIVVVTTGRSGTCCGLATVDTSGANRIRLTHGLTFVSSPAWAPATG
jgi:Tol biopolymer transport system component